MPPIDFNTLRSQNVFRAAQMPDVTTGGVNAGMSFMPTQVRPTNPYQVDFGANNLPIMQAQTGPTNPYTQSSYTPPAAAVQTPGLGPNEENIRRYVQNQMDIMNSFYSPETQASERLNQLLNNVPQYQNPNIWERIIAGGLAIGKDGQQAAEQYIRGPYANAMADWTAQAKPFYDAANLERNANVNERTLLNNMATNITAQQRLDEQQRHAQETEAIARQQNQMKMEAMNGTTFKLMGRTIVGTRIDGTAYDTGIDPQIVSPMDLANANNAAAMARARVNNAGAMDRTQAAGAGYYTDANGNLIQGNPRTQQPPVVINMPSGVQGPINRIGTSGQGGAEGPTPAEARQAESEKYAQVFNTYDFAQNWLIPPATANARWQLMPAPTDPTQLAEYNEVRSLLGIPMTGGEIPAVPRRQTDINLPSGAAPSVPREAAPGAARPIPQGYTEMRDPSGRLGLMRTENVAAAVAQGWTRTR